MISLEMARDLPAPPAAVWPHLTQPDLMNAWSHAKIRSLAPGAGGGPGDAGARREVQIAVLGLPVARLEEVVEESRPPSRFAYRVTGGTPARDHHATITLEPTPSGGSRLRWKVDFRFPLPGLGAAAKVLLERQLGESLDRLAVIVGRG